jgi:hypothetical protein
MGGLKALSIGVAELIISLPFVAADCFAKGLRLLKCDRYLCFEYECICAKRVG